MAEKKPIVLTDGQLEQLQQGDYLPNQPEIDELRNVLAKLIQAIEYYGFGILDQEVIDFKNNSIH